jgi:tetratricopeptide (TPR) repeat protein
VRSIAALTILVFLGAEASAQDLREQYGTRSPACAEEMDQGIKLGQANRPSDALPHFKKAIELDGECQMAYFWLADSLQGLGEIDEAIVALKKLVEVSKGRVTDTTVEGCVNAGIMLSKVGREPEAWPWFTRAIYLDPTDKCHARAKAYRNMAIGLANRGHALAGALAALSGFMTDPKRVEAALVKDLLDKAEGRQDEAADVLTLPADAPPLAARSARTRLERVGLDGAFDGAITRLLLDAPGHRMLVFTATTDHYFAIDYTAPAQKLTRIPAPGTIYAEAAVGGELYLVVSDPPRLVRVASDHSAARTWPLPELVNSIAVAPAQALAVFPQRGVVQTLDLDSGAVEPTSFSSTAVESDPQQRFVYSFVRPDIQTGNIMVDGQPFFFTVRDEWLQSTIYRYAIAGKKLLLASMRLNAASNAHALRISPDGRWATLIGGGGWRPLRPAPSGAGYGVAVLPTSSFESVQGYYAADAYPQGAAINPVTGQIAVTHGSSIRIRHLAAPSTELAKTTCSAAECLWSGDGRFLYVVRAIAGFVQPTTKGAVDVFSNELSDEEQASSEAWQTELAERVKKLQPAGRAAPEVEPIADLATFKAAAQRSDVLAALEDASKAGRSNKPVPWAKHPPYVADGETARSIAAAEEKVEAGDYGVAIYALKQIEPRNANHAALERLLGACYQATRQLDKAEAALTSAVNIDRGVTAETILSLRALARLKRDQGDIMAAAYCCATALRVDQADPRVHEDASDIFKRAGLEAETKAFLERAGGMSAPSAGSLPPLAKATPGTPLKGPEIFRKIAPSVVRIDTGESTGSGVCVAPEGVIVTNAHVVAGAHGRVTVQTFAWDGTQLVRSKTLKGEVVQQDDARDLAIVRVDAPPSTLVPVAVIEREVSAGEKVFAIGNPGMGTEILEQSISEGIVSSPLRRLDNAEYVQHTAGVNPGNSGGPLVDECGQIVGLVTLKAKLENVSFAVPAKGIRDLFVRPPR